MKLLNLEVTSHGELFHSRYEIFRENGAEVYYLTASQNSVLWPGFAGVRVLTDQIIDTLIAAARAWREEIRFDAILTTDEASVIATAAASEALSLPGLSLASARQCRNKYEMRLAHQQHQAPHPPFRLCETVDQALQAGARSVFTRTAISRVRFTICSRRTAARAGSISPAVGSPSRSSGSACCRNADRQSETAPSHAGKRDRRRRWRERIDSRRKSRCCPAANAGSSVLPAGA